MRPLSLSSAVVLSVGLFLVLLLGSGNAFVPSSSSTITSVRRTTTTTSTIGKDDLLLFLLLEASKLKSSSSKLLQMTGSSTESEKELRKEIADRNSKVENEEQYAILDGAGMATVVVEQQQQDDDDKDKAASDKNTQKDYSPDNNEVVTDESVKLQKKLDRLIKQRPYAMFLMEKAVEIVEDSVSGLFGDEKTSINSNKREKVVVLGTGWGAAAFLKGIDTSLYDVTVISPRNYFVFTPMLAGASVGTVDYRSITEPVREVGAAFIQL